MPDRLEPARFADLPGFATANHVAALAHMADVLARGAISADPVKREAWSEITKAIPSSFAYQDAKAFFEEHFDVWRVVDTARPEGLFTGYFEPEVHGSRRQSAAYPFAVYGRPNDLVAFDAAANARSGATYGKWREGVPVAYDTREEIDGGSLQGRADALCYVADKIALFFMHIQGSGRVRLEDGEMLRLGFAAKSGRPYQSIGAVLVREGQLSREAASMQSITAWINAHPEKRDWLLWQNPSYIFFRTLALADPQKGALGAAGAQLVPGLSIAIDKTRYSYGTPVWLDTRLPDGTPWQKLMIAADTGSAILGAARGDVYFGWGAEAEWQAGHMKQPGIMHVLLPKRR